MASKTLQRVMGWILANVALIAVVVAVFLFLFPGAYRLAVGLLPGYYYQFGTVAGPSYQRFDPWQVELNGVDRAQPSGRLNRLITAHADTVRLPEEAAVPGRVAPAGSARSAEGHDWRSGNCLFLKDIVLRLLKTSPDGSSRYLEDIKSDTDGSSNFSARKLAVDHQAQGGTELIARLPSNIRGCDLKLGACGELVVWGYGTTAPCSLWPF